MPHIKCAVCDWEIKDDGKVVEVDGQSVTVCCGECADKVLADSARYVKPSQ